MEITIDSGSGFCFGVTGAIKKAEEELKKGPLFCLGDIVHNGQEVDRLSNIGLKTIDYDDLRTLRGGKVLLRAHGEPPSTYRIAHDNGIEIIDASCPVVKKLQERIRDAYINHPEAQIVIFGKNGHAEVIGLQGQTNNNAIIIDKTDDIGKIDFNRDIYLFSQTTKAEDEFMNLVEQIEKHIGKSHFHWHNTICKNVANRVDQLKDFAKKQDIVVFVGGKKSSNAKVLFQHCLDCNKNTIFVDSTDELKQHTEQIKEFNHNTDNLKIGICGATSTPLWLMEACKNELQKNIR